MADIPIITLDGPTGSGKGTISRAIAQHLGWHLLDSGAIYRVLALAALRAEMDLTDEAALTSIATSLPVDFKPVPQGVQILLENEDVSQLIRSEACSSAASKTSAFPAVRAALLARQRAFARSPGLVADGRDMGTVVFTGAPLKIYLDAPAEERAKRRYHELNAKGVNVTLAQVLSDLNARDSRDMERSVSPLKPAEDAVILQTAGVSIEDVVADVLQEVERVGLIGG